jgi:MinD superfamily P-loop ATPase
MLYETLHKIEDFETRIKHIQNRNQLRLTIEEIGISEMAVKVSVILTIPVNNHILRHYVGKQLFNRYFYRMKDCTEFEDYKKFINNCMEKTKNKFGEITQGYWGE